MYFPSSFLFNLNPLIRFYVYNSVSFSFWLHLRLDLPRIRGNWEYVFLLPHLAHPCPPLCHARTNLGRRPESVSPHAHRLQCVNSIDHPLMCLFTIALTQAGCLNNTDSSLSSKWICVEFYKSAARTSCFKGRRDISRLHTIVFWFKMRSESHRQQFES